MNIAEIRKFASDASTVIEACQQLISEQQAEINQLTSKLDKQASAEPKASVEPKAGMDKDMLHKAACALHEVYGSPANVTVEQIEGAWEAKPEFMLSAITKLASALRGQNTSTGAELGQQITKKASAAAEKTADDIFMSKYV